MIRLLPLLASVVLLILTRFASAEHDQPSHIKLAAIVAQTGDATSSNRDSLIGIRFAVEEINQQGGVLGHPIELIELDNLSSPIGGKVAADAAVQREVHGVIGAAWSSHSLAMAPVLQQAGIPMLSPVSTTPSLTAVGDYIFRLCFVDTTQGQVMAQFAYNDLAVRKVVSFVDIRSDYSMGLASAFRQAFEQLGGTVLSEIEYQKKRQDFRPLLQQAASFTPDMLFLPTHDEMLLIWKHASELQFRPIMLGGDGWPSKGFTPDLHGYFSDHWSEGLDDEASRQFVQRFQQWQAQQNWPEQEKYQEIDAALALSYDAVHLFADAITRAHSLQRADIRQALADTQNFQGVTGDIQFNEQGDPHKPVIILEVTNGQKRFFRYVFPSESSATPAPTETEAVTDPTLSHKTHE